MNNEKLISILISDSLIYHANIYGIEGLEQKIKEIYKFIPKLKNEMLKEYRRLFLYERR
jgi:hypothetical protein